MLNHKFTLRETILILLAAILSLGIFYYEVIVKNYNDAKVIYNVSSLEDEMMVLSAKASRQKVMQDYINSHEDESVGEVTVYNNLANEITALASVLDEKADNVSINWSEPVLTDSIVRRNANITITASNYDVAKEIVKEIAGLEYRCVISQVSFSTGNDASLNKTDNITVSLTVTFFETTDGATNTSGLVTSNN